MRLRAAGESPPMVLLLLAVGAISTPPPPLPSARVPSTLVPMKLPSTLLLAEEVDKRMPSRMKPLITSPLITQLGAKQPSPNAFAVLRLAPLSSIKSLALVPCARLLGLEHGAELLEHGRWV